MSHRPKLVCMCVSLYEQQEIISSISNYYIAFSYLESKIDLSMKSICKTYQNNAKEIRLDK